MAESKAKKKFYAVIGGREGTTIYSSWDACKAQVIGVKGVIYKGFPTLEEAEIFLSGGTAAQQQQRQRGRHKPEFHPCPSFTIRDEPAGPPLMSMIFTSRPSR